MNGTYRDQTKLLAAAAQSARKWLVPHLNRCRRIAAVCCLFPLTLTHKTHQSKNSITTHSLTIDKQTTQFTQQGV